MSVLCNKINRLFDQYIDDDQADNAECVDTLNLIKQEVLQSIQVDYTNYSKRVAIIKIPYKTSKGRFVIHNSLESASKFIAKESRQDQTKVLENLTHSGKHTVGMLLVLMKYKLLKKKVVVIHITLLLIH